MNETKRKPKVGEKLFVVGHDRRTQEKFECVVVSVGHKYFKVKKCDSNYNFTFDFIIENWLENTGGYATRHTLYQNEKEYLDECEKDNLNSKLRSAFDCYGRTNFTLEQLRAVDAILFPPAPTEGAPCTNPA